MISSAVEGHFDHPHGRPWASAVDHVHPLMAEIVGENVSCDPRDNPADSQNLRCENGRSLYNGYLDRKSPLDDVSILQTDVGAIQALL